MSNTLGLCTGVAAAVTGGAFLTYSTFTMSAIRRLDAPAAVTAMRAVNVAAPRSVLFMAFLFLPGVAAVPIAILDGAGLLRLGATVYFLGVIGVTTIFHVPRNTRLESSPFDDAVRSWPAWSRSWVAGNHVRTVCGMAAGVLIVLGSA